MMAHSQRVRKMEQRKVLLVNPNQIKPVVVPLALDYIGGALKKRGYRVDLLDLAFTPLEVKFPSGQTKGAAVTSEDGSLTGFTDNFKGEIDRYFEKNSPEAIGITIRNTDDCAYPSSDFFLPSIKKIVDYIKKKTDSPIILGGCGFSIMPLKILEYLNVDLGIEGEGENSFPLLLEVLRDRTRYHRIPGLIYKTRQGFKHIPQKFLDLDKSLILRDTVDNLRYFKEGGMGALETKRGCDKECIYCADPLSKGRRYRVRPPLDVVREIKALLSQGIDCFHICDSEFNLPYSQAIDVLREITRKGLGDKIGWYTYANPLAFTEKLADLMKKAGCKGIDFGADSGNNQILRNLGKNFNKKELIRTAKICHKHKIIFMYDLLLGGPGENKETLKETIDLMKEINPSKVGLAIGIRIYKGSYLSKIVEKEGVTKDNKNLYGKIDGNEDFFEPIFYISNEIGDEITSYVKELVGKDERFLFSFDNDKERNYNYNQNILLIDAIKKGYRGAFWDILRRIQGHQGLVPDQTDKGKSFCFSL